MIKNVNTGVATSYYASSSRVAMRTAAGVTYIHSDHLRSTSATSGVQSGDIKYYPYGATRSGAVSTAYRFTGQRLAVSIYGEGLWVLDADGGMQKKLADGRDPVWANQAGSQR